MTINLSALSWAFSGVGQEERSHATKALVSLTPEMKIGVLLGRSPARRLGLATRAERVVPSGMPLSGPDTS
jgi:hypothetical protein